MQHVRDKAGPLEDNAGNIITQGYLMAEGLNMHFSSVFTREDTSWLPIVGWSRFWRENLDWFTAQIERTISEYFTT